MCYFRKGLRRALIGTEYDSNMLQHREAQRFRLLGEQLRTAIGTPRSQPSKRFQKRGSR